MEFSRFAKEELILFCQIQLGGNRISRSDEGTLDRRRGRKVIIEKKRKVFISLWIAHQTVADRMHPGGDCWSILEHHVDFVEVDEESCHVAKVVDLINSNTKNS